jgi:hypothetical protein
MDRSDSRHWTQGMIHNEIEHMCMYVYIYIYVYIVHTLVFCNGIYIWSSKSRVFTTRNGKLKHCHMHSSESRHWTQGMIHNEAE